MFKKIVAILFCLLLFPPASDATVLFSDDYDSPGDNWFRWTVENTTHAVSDSDTIYVGILANEGSVGWYSSSGAVSDIQLFRGNPWNTVYNADLGPSIRIRSCQ